MLGCSFLELNSHPDKAELMTIAATIAQGENDGEYMRELNPKYQQIRKEMQDKMSAARG